MKNDQENTIQKTVDNYIAAKLPDIERELRQAFLAGVSTGIELAQKIYTK